MIRNLFVFLAAFVASALIALVVRATMFQPHAAHEGHPAAGGDYAPMVSNPQAPAREPVAPAKAAPTAVADPHAGHGAAAAPAADTGKPVNTVCAICGMDVDPKLPTAQYQGKTIGFGCKMCPPKFKADPDRYGPAYLRNEVIKK
jgi:YHS domain-containing protein